MAFEQLEPILYLPDDTSFYPDVGDEFHTARIAWRAAGLIGLVLLAYIPAIVWGGFIWQDDWHVSQNILLWSWTGLARTWAHGLGGQYHPLAQTLLWIEHHFRGQAPSEYHLVSALLHGGNCILLWMLLRRLGMRGAWLGAALFAVHPVQVQSVAWISQQSHLLCAGLCMGSAWAFLRLNRIRPPMPADILPSDITDVDQLLEPEPAWLLYGLSIGLAIAAVLSDTVALALPLVLLVLVWWKRDRIGGLIWLELLPFFALSIIGAAGAIWVGTGNPEPGGIAPALTLLQRFLISSRAIWAYASGIVWPYPILFVYPRWNVPVGDASQFLFPIGTILVIAVAWAGKRFWGKGPLAAVLLFIILLLPAFWVVLESSAPPIFIADHLEYLAACVPLAAAVWVLIGPMSLISSSIVQRLVRAAVALALLAPLGVLAWMQSLNYDSSDTLWKATLAQDPGVTVARILHAMNLVRSGKPLDAADVLRDAPSGPRDVAMLQAWGQVYTAQNRYSDAVDAYTDAMKAGSDNREIVLGLANALFKMGRVDEAMQTYRDELNRNPDDEACYNSLGQIFASQGKRADAIDMYKRALSINPRSIPPKINYANILFEMGRPREAAEQLQQVVAIDPSYFATFVVAATMQIQLRDYAGAEQNCRLALRLNAKSAEAWNNLGVAQCNLGHVPEAIVSFQKAIEHRPNYEEAKKNLELARRNLVS